MKKIACLGDTSSHGGTIITSNQSGKYKTKGIENAADQCLHSCPLFYGPGMPHGVTPVTAITTKSWVESKLIVTEDAVAGCGAIITPSDRQHYVE